MGALRTRLKWLMGLRVVAVTLLLGLAIALQIAKGELAFAYYALIILTYATTITYAIALTYLTSEAALVHLAYFQVGVDLLLETGLVVLTGGIESPFAVLYMITIALASLILRRWGSLMTAGLSVILFGLVTNVQLYGLVETVDWFQPSRLTAPATFHTFGIHALAFMLVGYLSGTVAKQLDRTDRSLVEKERGLSRLRAFHENVVQSISSGVFTTDPEGRITSFNPAAEETTGYRFEAVAGRDWWGVFNWEEGQEFITRPGSLDQPYRFEAEGKRADGSRLVLGMTLTALTEGETKLGQVGVFKDLTHIRDIEEEMRRQEWLATLGEMSAGMAHEIRNPLAALAGAMQIMRKDLPSDDTNARLMDIAVREATRLDGIITEFLQYARPPALNLKECDLNAALRDTLTLIKHEAQTRAGIQVTTLLANGRLTAEVDQDQLKQVFWNLAVNAFDAMPSGGLLTISSSSRRVTSGGQVGEFIEIGFEDTGEGIQKQNLDKIFLPFFTTKQKGSGLGLAAVHRIVDLHNGWIRVASQEGKGSRFTVCLPLSVDAGLRLWHEGREPWKRS